MRALLVCLVAVAVPAAPAAAHVWCHCFWCGVQESETPGCPCCEAKKVQPETGEASASCHCEHRAPGLVPPAAILAAPPAAPALAALPPAAPPRVALPAPSPREVLPPLRV